jgi:hypothetical protein
MPALITDSPGSMCSGPQARNEKKNATVYLSALVARIKTFNGAEVPCRPVNPDITPIHRSNADWSKPGCTDAPRTGEREWGKTTEEIEGRF